MNILQKFSQLENNDILNKIYSYLGKHPIVEKTRLTDVITKYTMILKTHHDYRNYLTPANKKTFSYFYFENLRSIRRSIKYEKNRIKRNYSKLNDEFDDVVDEYYKLLFYYDNNLLFDYEESNNLQIFSNFYFYNLNIYKLIVSHIYISQLQKFIFKRT